MIYTIAALASALKSVGFFKPVTDAPLKDIFHKVDDTPGYRDANPIEISHELDEFIYEGVNETCFVSRYSNLTGQCKKQPDANETALTRKRREIDIPFYYIGGGYTFNQPAFDEVRVAQVFG